MDAKVGDWVVTPRHGKPVEIQALWYNALRLMARLAKEFRDEPAVERFMEMASRARESFNQQFWNEELGCLYDVIDGDQRDASMRPFNATSMVPCCKIWGRTDREKPHATRRTDVD